MCYIVFENSKFFFKCLFIKELVSPFDLNGMYAQSYNLRGNSPKLHMLGS